MANYYPDVTKAFYATQKQLRNDIPEVMQSVAAVALAATKDGVLDKKTKELMALAIAVSIRCDGCIGYHSEALVKLGATRQEVEEALGMAIYMGGGPAVMYATNALVAYEQFKSIAEGKS